jgi:hypothetical protein
MGEGIRTLILQKSCTQTPTLGAALYLAGAGLAVCKNGAVIAFENVVHRLFGQRYEDLVLCRVRTEHRIECERMTVVARDGLTLIITDMRLDASNEVRCNPKACTDRIGWFQLSAGNSQHHTFAVVFVHQRKTAKPQMRQREA